MSTKPAIDLLLEEVGKLSAEHIGALDGFLIGGAMAFAKQEHAELVAERDDAQRNLSALEWLTENIEGSFYRCDCGMHEPCEVIEDGVDGMRFFPTWYSAAREYGYPAPGEVEP
jgi:hypothetical protein